MLRCVVALRGCVALRCVALGCVGLRVVMSMCCMFVLLCLLCSVCYGVSLDDVASTYLRRRPRKKLVKSLL